MSIGQGWQNPPRARHFYGDEAFGCDYGGPDCGGRDLNEPAALIQNATMADQRVLVSSVGNWRQRRRQAALAPPP